MYCRCFAWFAYCVVLIRVYCLFFFFNDTATTEIYTLSLHDALPIYPGEEVPEDDAEEVTRRRQRNKPAKLRDYRSGK